MLHRRKGFPIWWRRVASPSVRPAPPPEERKRLALSSVAAPRHPSQSAPRGHRERTVRNGVTDLCCSFAAPLLALYPRRGISCRHPVKVCPVARCFVFCQSTRPTPPTRPCFFHGTRASSGHHAGLLNPAVGLRAGRKKRGKRGPSPETLCSCALVPRRAVPRPALAGGHRNELDPRAVRGTGGAVRLEACS